MRTGGAPGMHENSVYCVQIEREDSAGWMQVQGAGRQGTHLCWAG